MIIEAALFQSAEPVTHGALSKAAGVSEKECGGILEELSEACRERGYILLNDGHAARFALSPQVSEIFRKEQKKTIREPLSPSARETLSVIAYAGPISRTDVDIVRGVNSRYSTDRLVHRGYVQAHRKDDQSFLSVTVDFLTSMALSDVTALPEYEKHREHIHSALNTIKETFTAPGASAL